jgi:hypothetical protein
VPVKAVNFSCIGGAHHFFHLAPVMVELARSGDALVTAFTANDDDSSALQKILTDLSDSKTANQISIIVMRLPQWWQMTMRWNPKWQNSKLAKLLYWARTLRSGDAIIAAERTSTILCRLPGKDTAMIHIPHGAGDRSKGFEPRIKLFDYVIVGGKKDRNRMIAMQLVAPENCYVSGYVKLAGVLAINRKQQLTRTPIFENDRPVILYNPHFNEKLSSWPQSGVQIIEAIKRDGRFNLIVAPHVRLFAEASDVSLDKFNALANQTSVYVDAGSERSMDMSYTLAADIYLGDVSSQVYEFMFRPRPCIFFDSHGAKWENNPDYLMWTAGKVISGITELMPALASCQDMHKDFASIQHKLVADAFGDVDGNGAVNAAQIIMQIIQPPASAK